MEKIKYFISNTLPDQLGSKFTKSVLKKFRDQINSAVPFLPLTNNCKESEKIGYVNNASLINLKLEATINVNTKLIDKRWEYFFVPNGIIKKRERQGKIDVVTLADIISVSMVRYPTDLTLKPIRFEPDFKEGVDYHIHRFDDMKPEMVLEYLKRDKPVYVYYPLLSDVEEAIKDATERGLFLDGNILPFEVITWPKGFDNFKKHIRDRWKKQNTVETENLLKKLLSKQSKD